MRASAANNFSATPLTDGEFAAALDRLGPFENAPHFAIAVSGGADSLGLCLLAHRYATQAGGKVTALTVDHGLRKESAAEAKQVAAWLKKHGIAHVTLPWHHPPTSNLQSKARDARYRLMSQWCCDHRVFWLMTAHHQDDQAETFLLRLSRGSGLEGLCAMSPLTPQYGITLLRPLLAFPKARLETTLRALKQPWIEDPSNASDAYQRNRLRHWLATRPDDVLPPSRIADATAALGRARTALEQQAAQLMARQVEISPLGYLTFARDMLRDAPEELGLRMLARMFGAIGGEALPPRLEKLARVYRHVQNGFDKPFTFMGCLCLPTRHNRAFVLREPAACEPSQPIRTGETILWDKRWQLTLSGPAGAEFTVGALGADAKTAADALPKRHLLRALPKKLLFPLPALRRLDEVLFAPHIPYPAGKTSLQARFTPPKPLAGAAFFAME